MNDREIDELLKRANAPQDPNAETLVRIAESISGSMRPVRSLPPRWILGGALALISSAVALSGAAGLGFFGIGKMSPLERVAVFSVLGILVLTTASELVSAMIPGSRRRFSSSGLLSISGICLAAVFALTFDDYQTTHFMHAGLVCLGIGLLHAIVAGLLSWLILRRGFAVNPVSAGLTAGTMAGLTGMSMLELHCPNFQLAHLLVWHLGVLVVSAGLGALCGWHATSTSATRRHASNEDTTHDA